MRWPLCFYLVLLLPYSVLSQQRIVYSTEFVFKEGIYLSFQDFKNNNPVPITYIISDLDIRSEDYIDEVLSYDTVHFYDNLLEERRVATDNIWGYCKRNRVFVAFGEKQSYNNPEFFDFYPLLNIGAVSYFSATEAYYRTMSVGPQVGIGFRDPMMNDQMTVTETGQVQLLLEFSSGRLLLANRGELRSTPPELVSDLIRSDPVLLMEFQALAVRDQKLKGMFYIRKFNERNPIYFPVN